MRLAKHATSTNLLSVKNVMTGTKNLIASLKV